MLYIGELEKIKVKIKAVAKYRGLLYFFLPNRASNSNIIIQKKGSTAKESILEKMKNTLVNIISFGQNYVF
jgi:hypothetical protein|tara:strand:- start:480 stop:692 length:213 start_codon:yes stop_codon:yes gene_type:complete